MREIEQKFNFEKFFKRLFCNNLYAKIVRLLLLRAVRVKLILLRNNYTNFSLYFTKPQQINSLWDSLILEFYFRKMKQLRDRFSIDKAAIG